ncbi:DUF1924 domain-containing protein [Dechloromonas agitata]|uniref:DUF1924 domain-containing protein n=1 Tax=Dechloromonas agitata TaxID=73030 RepID=UPI0004851EAF|nr:DUF1924 domain-containing protein [Dechloromonas agitata]
MKFRFPLLVSLVTLAAGAAYAEIPADFLHSYQAEARRADPGFAASAPRGQQFFKRTGNQDWSCSTCHTENPLAMGKHATTGKSIDPLAPAANDKRFTRQEKVEKWFKRNCNDVLGRQCTPAEKSDVIAYLISVKR